MKKVGEIFREERLKRRLSIDRVVKITKIPRRFLLAIENGDYSRLPRGVYLNLYIKEYSRFFKLPEQKMLAIFRRDYQPTTQSFRERFHPMALKSWLQWRRLLSGGLILLVFAGYLFYQYMNFVSPPKVRLNVLDLASGERMIKGKTDPQASLKIDNEAVNLDKSGHFSYLIKDKDKKEVVVVAESPAGKERKIIKKLKH